MTRQGARDFARLLKKEGLDVTWEEPPPRFEFVFVLYDKYDPFTLLDVAKRRAQEQDPELYGTADT
ncbi:hypothetical protein [Vibrio orientalis]|nr:hypothetical protein [Vibrio orientalis]